VPENQLNGISLVPILKDENLKGNKYILIKRGNGFTLKTPNFSYTEFIKAEDNSTITSMLYDHRIDKEENVNVVNNPEYEAVVKQLKTILHMGYQKNIEGN
jgi:hypothetical protein